MRVRIVLILVLSVLLYSCSKDEPSIVEFRGDKFELPGKVKDVQKSLDLEYGYYSGFYRRNVNSPNITTQLEGYPVFMGSDNDSEESYYDHNIVGVTYQLDANDFDKTRLDMEKAYASTFSKKTIKPSWVTDEYWTLKTDDNLHIVLIENLKNNDTVMSITFYKGIGDDEVEDYVTNNSNKYAY